MVSFQNYGLLIWVYFNTNLDIIYLYIDTCCICIYGGVHVSGQAILQILIR
jgi:hypothetical protein